MTERIEVTETEIEVLFQHLKKEAEDYGYHLNPDLEFTKEFIKGLLINERRYGYQNCPCRLASGDAASDLDMVCPCDYRDADLTDFGTCFCGLYVVEAVVSGKQTIGSIPDRRPVGGKKTDMVKKPSEQNDLKALPLPVWRCKVCGYLCARDAPPEVCPICKAKKERFERFM
jgi:ferredoxin-thioredoxin reductase catalytic subunit